MSVAPREFVFIRHGESESNANLVTQHTHTINLTSKGWQQAQDKAAGWMQKPDIFITSKYIRTKQTATPFVEKFPDVPMEEWDIHEFTFLAARKYENTTYSERQPFTQKYWEQADPHFKDSPDAESFFEFTVRCKAALKKMQSTLHKSSVAFCHGYFINGVILALNGQFDAVNSNTMKVFLDFHREFFIENCADIRFQVNDNDIRYTVDRHNMKTTNIRTD